jgi:hypothetical protein
VELEVEVTEGSGTAPARPRPAGPGAPTGPGAALSSGGGGHHTDGRSQERTDLKRRTEDRTDDKRGAEGLDGGDPMSELITEMVENGPSSVLDLAERVNTDEGHYAMADEVPSLSRRAMAPSAAAAPAPLGAPVPNNANFALMLERIVREAGLAVPAAPPAAPAPTGPPLPETSASHSSTILTELRPAPPSVPPRPAPPVSLERPGDLSGLGLAVHALGLPLPACQTVRSVTTREELEQELCRALQLALPPLPGPPKLPTSIVAVVGPRDEVMSVARAVTDDIGASREELAIATQRPVWRAQERVLGPVAEVAEERRAWRWRGRPSVVAIEQPVRAGGSPWASDMLRALEPALCWGVAEASRKPEDLASWSRSLGGIDVLALVDLEGTTTPAAALASGLPVGTLDGQPATPQLWASILCARLMG